MNQPKSTPPEQGPQIGLVLSVLPRAEPKGAEADEPIPLTIPLDRPEQPVQPRLNPSQPEPEPQLLGGLARDDDDWK
jgi:hypothetical protein